MKNWLNFKVSHVIRETPDAITIHLKPENLEITGYQPGQFLTLLFNRRGMEIRRSFSLSSAPGIDDELAITIKRIPNGEISTYLFHHVKEGDSIQVLPPAGRFVLPPQIEYSRDVIMIAAGSGITPVFSILKSLLCQEPGSRITLIYSNHNEKNTIFFRELNALSHQYKDQFKCIYIFSDPEEKTYTYHGHLNLGLLKNLISENQHFEKTNAVFLLCGPYTYMRMAEMIIIAMGFSQEQVKKENFVILAEQEAISRSPVQSPKDKHIYIRSSGRNIDFRMAPGVTLLTAATAQGIQVPYSCKGGVCGTCAAICTSGKVAMSINDVLTPKELKQGWVLTCVGYPVSEEVSLLFGSGA